MTPEQFELAQRLEEIFLPTTRARRTRLYQDGSACRFVHYTSADAALSIIRTKRLWLRNTTCMADYREVQHGFDNLRTYFSDEARIRQFHSVFDDCHAGVATEAINLFNGWGSDILSNTYIASVSAHDDREDQHGRLSMWRGFGGNGARVGLVFRVPWRSAAAATLNVRFSPVTYLRPDEVSAEFEAVMQNVRANRDWLRTLDRQIISNSIYHMLETAVTCRKHEGFHEEQEWRAIYAPRRFPSEYTESELVTVNGIPQLVFKLPLDAKASPALADLDLAAMFDSLIIGPSQYPGALNQAFAMALLGAGVQDAANRIRVSGIPLRA